MKKKPDFYDPDRAEAAAELWDRLRSFEGEDNDAQLIIEKAMSEYACTADKRIEDSEWAQKYRSACEMIGQMHEALMAIKYTCLTCKDGPKGLAHVVRLCIDAGIKFQLPELEKMIPDHAKHAR